MRMKYMYYILKENYDILNNFKIESESYKVGNATNLRGIVSNWKSVREALIKVSVIPSIGDFCLSILDNPFMVNSKDSFRVPQETYNELSPKYRAFLENIKSVISFYEAAGFTTNENGFDIKMPPTDDFEEFAKNIESLNKAINKCPYLNIKDEKIILKKTDIGSIWLEFGIATAGVSIFLSNLAKIVDKCVKIKSHYVTMKQQEELWRSSKLKNDLLETLSKANKEVMDNILNECVEELKDEISNIELKGDDITRVKYSLDTISNLMQNGLEIYASIDSPQEVKDLFPTSDEMCFFPKPQKLLEEVDGNVDA